MASSLAALPIEITELVAGNLDLTSLRSLRLACKELNRKTLHYFRLSFFTTVRTDLAHKSLEKLQGISNEQPLRYYVQTLLINKRPDSKGNWYDAFQNDFPWRRGTSGSLEAPLPGAHILRDILVGSLVNCRSFHINGYEDVKLPYEPDRLTPDDIVGVILAIIAETSLPVKSFSIDYHRTGGVDRKQLQLPLHRRPEFTSGWSHLQELVLEISINPDDSEWVRNLILRACRLRKLSLKFHYGFFFPLMKSLISEHGLKELQCFSLASLFVTVEQIPELLSNSRNTLRELCLQYITLDSGDTWETIMRGLKSHFPVLDSIFFFTLRERALKQYTNIWFPTLAQTPKVPRAEQTASPRSEFHVLQPLGLAVRLSYKNFCKEVMVAGVSYHGSEMGTFLEILAGSIERDRRWG